MRDAPKRRWFQFSLRTILICFVPYLAVVTWIVLLPYQTSDYSRGSAGLTGDAIASYFWPWVKLAIAIVFTLAWSLAWICAKPLWHSLKHLWRSIRMR
jgi:hypothetical protein